MLHMGNRIQADDIEQKIDDLAIAIAAQNDKLHWQSEARRRAYEKVLRAARAVFDAHPKVFATYYEERPNSPDTQESGLELVVAVKTWDDGQEERIARVSVQALVWLSRPGVFRIAHATNGSNLDELRTNEEFELNAYREEWIGAYGYVLRSLWLIVNGWKEERDRLIPSD